jgi:2-polyprenyl-3-methyl-5-hydroxy-6-metoxy-1,4-benzoquinol methylase
MDSERVHEIEIAKWDALANATGDERLRVKDADFGAYARRVGTMVGIAEFLGDLRGRTVLELGCGKGELSVLLALSGAQVTAFDISPASIEVTRRRAALHGVEDRIELVVAVGEQLPFDDERFEVAVGKAVLHHLDATRAAPELHRVLRPGAHAAFSEPLGTNPVLAFARDHVPYPHKNPRGADIPLRREDLAHLTAPFAQSHVRPIQLLTMLERALGFRRMPRLRAADAWLLERVPQLRSWCRYVVVTMVR